MLAPALSEDSQPQPPPEEAPASLAPVPWRWVAVMAVLFVVFRVAFLRADPPEVLPHEINFRANIWALKTLGVHAILGVCPESLVGTH